MIFKTLTAGPFGICLALLGCGAASSESAAAPPPAAPVAPAPAPAATPSASSETVPAPEPAPVPATSGAPSSTSAEEEKKSEASRRQSPTDMLTARDAAFLVDYANSTARTTADAECDKEAKGDPAAKGACLEKARDKFLPDVLRFKKDEQGRVSLVIYKRAGSSLREVYLSAIELTEEGTDSVRLKFIGREKGQRPLFKSGNNLVQVPNDYSIELSDPQFGKLTYNAKIGLVSNQ